MLSKVVDAKLLKFIVVGVINTLVGMVIMFGLYNFARCSYWISSAVNYILTSILSYILNSRFTFRYRSDSISSVIRFVGNIAACYLIAFAIAKPLIRWIICECSVTLQENIAMIAGMCIFTGLNYIGQRFIVFREK